VEYLISCKGRENWPVRPCRKQYGERGKISRIRISDGRIRDWGHVILLSGKESWRPPSAKGGEKKEGGFLTYAREVSA